MTNEVTELDQKRQPCRTTGLPLQMNMPQQRQLPGRHLHKRQRLRENQLRPNDQRVHQLRPNDQPDVAKVPGSHTQMPS